MVAFIGVAFRTNASPALRAAFDNAIATWESLILGPGDPLTLNVYVRPLDGQSGVLADARVSAVHRNGLPRSAVIRVDVGDIDALDRADLLDDTIRHEIGHALGIGTVFARKRLVRNGPIGPVFVGPAATAAYSALTGRNEQSVPLDPQGFHWSETAFDDELMTPILDQGSNPLSTVTAAALTDLGYQTAPAQPHPQTEPQPEPQPEPTPEPLQPLEPVVTFTDTHVVITIEWAGDVRDGVSTVRRKLTTEGNNTVTINGRTYERP